MPRLQNVKPAQETEDWRIRDLTERCYAKPLERATRGHLTFVGDRVVGGRFPMRRSPVDLAESIRPEVHLGAAFDG